MADYYFNFPPLTALTIAQQAALNDPNPIAISGGPGTGKSFVSIWRHINNHRRANPIRSQLLTFTTTLAFYLKQSSRSQNYTSGNYVDSTHNWYSNHPSFRDEIIVDEAQDMPIDFYRNKLRTLTRKLSYGADNKQILKADATNNNGTFNLSVCSPESELSQIFRNQAYPLDKNFRNTKRIIQFAKTVFDNAYIPPAEINSCRIQGDKPIMYITKSEISEQNNAIIQIIRQFNSDQHNIGILTPLATVPWAGGHTLTARYYYDLLKDSFDCSFYDYTLHEGTGLTSMKNIHITPFKSAKGLEFDTVIIPHFDKYNHGFRVLSWRDFFVGVTRAKSNLFLFCESDLNISENVVEKIYFNNNIDNLNYNGIQEEEGDLPF